MCRVNQGLHEDGHMIELAARGGGGVIDPVWTRWDWFCSLFSHPTSVTSTVVVSG